METKEELNIMTNSNSILQEIKTGVAGMITEVNILKAQQENHEKELQHLGKQASSDRKQGWGNMACESRADFEFGKAIKIAVATVQGTLGQDHDLTNSKEFKIMNQATQKAMDTGTSGAGGGYTIPSEYVPTLIEMQRANSVAIQAGATVMDSLKGSPVLIPKQLSSATVAWLGQNTSISLSDPSFGQVSMTPKTMAIRCQYSNLLQILSQPGMDKILQRDLAKVCGLELDRVALRGSGSSNQPLGLNGMSGLGTYAIGANGGDLTRQDLLKMVGVVDDANALTGKLAFVMNPKAKRVLKNERIAQYSGQTLGEYVQYPLTDLTLAKGLDYPVYSTTQIPTNLTKSSSSDCSEVYFGNWEELMIGIWGGLEILATNIGGNAWAQNAIEVRLIQNCDVQVRHAQSFVLCSDARTNNA
jgi:HK97 family phage major capsid protein